MPHSIRASFAAATVSLALASASFAAPSADPGFVDIGTFMPSAKGEFVDVNISPALLKFATRIAKTQEPEISALLANLRSIRVNVVRLDDQNRADTLAKIDGVRRQLEASGWNRLVTVREGNGGENVDVHVMQPADDVIQGVVVTVINKKGEVVFVNIVGNINADQIGLVAEKFNLEPLRKLKLAGAKS
ncbi:MAG: DUF4252 domain-containing protein [Opitutaceae bacterium]|nr:DUF4252 domain-containing protein [Opitutaceae bacterium]